MCVWLCVLRVSLVSRTSFENIKRKWMLELTPLLSWHAGLMYDATAEAEPPEEPPTVSAKS